MYERRIKIGTRETQPGIMRFLEIVFRYDPDMCSMDRSFMGPWTTSDFQSFLDASRTNLSKDLSRDTILRILAIAETYGTDLHHYATDNQIEGVIFSLVRSPNWSWVEACKSVCNSDLKIDDGFEFMSERAVRDVPEKIIRYIFSLPGEGHSCNDIFCTFSVSPEDFFSVLNLSLDEGGEVRASY